MFDAVSICFPEGCLHQPSQVVGVFLSERDRLHLGVRFGSVQPGLDFWTAYFAPDAAFFRVPLHAVVLALLTLEVCRMTVANHFVEGLKLCPSFGVAAILAPPDTKEMVMISAMRVFLGFYIGCSPYGPPHSLALRYAGTALAAQAAFLARGCWGLHKMGESCIRVHGYVSNGHCCTQHRPGPSGAQGGGQAVSEAPAKLCANDTSSDGAFWVRCLRPVFLSLLVRAQTPYVQ